MTYKVYATKNSLTFVTIAEGFENLHRICKQLRRYGYKIRIAKEHANA